MEIRYDTKSMAVLMGTTYDSFLKHSIRFEDKFKRGGNTMIKEGKGKKAIYHVELFTGFKSKCPQVMEKFEEYFLSINGHLCFYSEKSLAKLLLGSESKATGINTVRNELIEQGQFVSEKDQTHFLKVIYTNGKRYMVDALTFNEAFRYDYFIPRDKELQSIKKSGVVLTEELIKETNSKYWKVLVESLGGIPAKVKAKEPTDLFYTMRGTTKKPFGIEDSALEKLIDETIFENNIYTRGRK